MKDGKRKLAGAFSYFHPVKVLLVGDYMLDRYTTGYVKRISPEAPVPVLAVEEETSRPGGAGNVVLNLLALGAEVVVLGRIGKDLAGKELKKKLKDNHADVRCLFEDDFYTPVKNRLIANSQQLLRVDKEQIVKISSQLEAKVLKVIPQLVKKVQAIALSDYGKGFLSNTIISTIIQEAKKNHISIIVDPKGSDFSKYAKATIIKPNLSEAYAAAKVSTHASLEEVADTLLKKIPMDILMITRSEAGITLFDKERNRYDYPPIHIREVKDVTGAGDTVLATISIALSNGMDIHHAVQLANIAAGIAVEHIGCAHVSLSDVAHRLLQFDIESKIFEERHLYALRQVLNGRKITVLGICCAEGLSTDLFASICQVASDKTRCLIIYVKETNPDEKFIKLLSALKEIDFIILRSENLRSLCQAIQPDEVYEIKNGKIVSLSHAKALLGDLRQKSFLFHK